MTAYDVLISDWSSDVCSSDLVVSAAEVDAELARIGHDLRPFDIVLVQSGAIYGTDNFTDQGCGMGAKATLYLTERGVQVVGTDAWSWDAPFSHTARRWADTRDPSIIWEGHKAGRIRPYYQIEKKIGRASCRERVCQYG